ncbi:MAG: hypothetical protein M0P91_05195 [Sulfuricurvum sp.]|jgi:hypothetical protein|uniref:hypothetical protein n=1 Tax=Sulfuricurvum sp. TaxID=2025608 RepID=UPI0025ED2DBA|nr:hypothetical protein [Sulfuricurvum sp.]MCK9372571.1 hypothetical protein [Sulfuricurvum sp.]
MDILSFVADTAALIAEVKEKFPEYVTEDGKFMLDKTPSIRSAAGTLSYLRVTQEELTKLNTLNSVQLLGDYDTVFADPATDAIYRSVFDYTQPGVIDKRIGVFA